MRAPANWKQTIFYSSLMRQSKATPPLHTSSQREVKDVPKAHVGSLWQSRRSHDFQIGRISPFQHRPFFPSFITKAWLRPLALGTWHWPTLHPDPSPGVVRALEFLCGFLSAGSWQQLRAYQMPGWWAPSKHTDRQFLWLYFFISAHKTSPNSSSAPSALGDIWSPDGQGESQQDGPGGTHGCGTELWLRSSVLSPVFIFLSDPE